MYRTGSAGKAQVAVSDHTYPAEISSKRPYRGAMTKKRPREQCFMKGNPTSGDIKITGIVSGHSDRWEMRSASQYKSGVRQRTAAHSSVAHQSRTLLTYSLTVNNMGMLVRRQKLKCSCSMTTLSHLAMGCFFQTGLVPCCIFYSQSLNSLCAPVCHLAYCYRHSLEADIGPGLVI